MKMRLAVGVLVALLAFGVAGLAQAGAPIRLGVIAPLSGPGTSYGLGIKQWKTSPLGCGRFSPP